MIIAPGATSVSVDVGFYDDAGAALTGKVAADFPACKWSSGINTADTTITLSDLAAITTAHPNDNTAGGIKEREGGVYRLDLPNNMFTAAGIKGLTFAETTNKRIIVLGGVFEVQAEIAAAKQNTDYPDDCVMLDTVNGTAGTTVGTHGTARTPSLTFVDAAAIAAARGKKRVRFAASVPATISSGTYSNYDVDINGAILSLNNDAVFSGGSRLFSSVHGGSIKPDSGAGQSFVNLDTAAVFENVTFANNVRAVSYCYLKNCSFPRQVSFTMLGDSGSSEVSLQECYAGFTDGMTFDCAGGADLILDGWYGDITITNLAAGTTVRVYGYAKATLAASCTGGTFRHTSHVEVTDNSGGAVTKDLVSEPTSLSANGLDALTVSDPVGVPTTFVGWFMWMIRRFAPKTPSGKVTMPKSGNGNLVVYASDGTTPITTQAVTDDGTTQTLNKVS